MFMFTAAVINEKKLRAQRELMGQKYSVVNGAIDLTNVDVSAVTAAMNQRFSGRISAIHNSQCNRNDKQRKFASTEVLKPTEKKSISGVTDQVQAWMNIIRPSKETVILNTSTFKKKIATVRYNLSDVIIIMAVPPCPVQDIHTGFLFIIIYIVVQLSLKTIIKTLSRPPTGKSFL